MFQRKTIQDFAWEVLLEKLRLQRGAECAVVLGEGAFFTPSGKLLQTEYQRFLKKQFAHVCPEDGSTDFLILPTDERTTFCTYLRRFYAGQAMDPMLQELVKIPFPVIINVTPHLQLQKAFASIGIEPRNETYNMSGNLTEKLPLPTASQPLIYNLFGSIEDDNSLVLTFNDLFAYFESSVADKLPHDFLEILRNVKYFVFIGVPLDKWYFHFLLRILGIHRYKSANRHALAEGMPSETIDFCNQMFAIKFVEQGKDVQYFVETMYNHCDAVGILRQDADGAQSALDKIVAFIESDELEEAFELLETFLEAVEDDAYINDFNIISGNYRRLLRKINNKLVTEEQGEVEMNKTKRALKAFIKECKNINA
ncbi:MAG: hypothetical protein RL329_1712 [Bacteroidota bacterium]